LLKKHHGSAQSFSCSGAGFDLVGCEASKESILEFSSSSLAISFSVSTVPLKADINQEKRCPQDKGCDAETQDDTRRLPPWRTLVLILTGKGVDIEPQECRNCKTEDVLPPWQNCKKRCQWLQT